MAVDLTHNMRTHCVGRYLIDLPENLLQEHQLVDGPGDVTFYFGRDENFKTVDVTVVAEHVSAEQFSRAIHERVEAIAKRTNYETNGSMLVAQKQWASNAVLLRYYSSQDIADSHSHEVHLLVDDAHVALRTNSFEGQMEPAESRLRAMIPEIQKIENSGRTTSGFCVGPVEIASSHDFEEAKIVFVQPSRKQDGVRMLINYNTFKQAEDEPSLIARGESNLQGLDVRPKVIRKGERSLAGAPGEEWLGEFKQEAIRQLSFYAETDSQEPSQAQPKIHVELHAGGQTVEGEQVSASLTEAEALVVWDAIVGTLRK